METRPNLGGYIRALGSRDKKSKEPSPPYVTISRESGAGGREVGASLARLLSQARSDVPWKFYDRELVDKIIADHNLSEKLRASLEEEQISRIDDWVSSVIEHSVGHGIHLFFSQSEITDTRIAHNAPPMDVYRP